MYLCVYLSCLLNYVFILQAYYFYSPLQLDCGSQRVRASKLELGSNTTSTACCQYNFEPVTLGLFSQLTGRFNRVNEISFTIHVVPKSASDKNGQLLSRFKKNSTAPKKETSLREAFRNSSLNLLQTTHCALRAQKGTFPAN